MEFLKVICLRVDIGGMNQIERMKKEKKERSFLYSRKEKEVTYIRALGH